VVTVVVPSGNHVGLGPHQARPHVTSDHGLLAHHARRVVTFDAIRGTDKGHRIRSSQVHILAAVSEADRRRWDERYTETDGEAAEPRLPEAFAPVAHQFPGEGLALETAAGRGELSVWLALRGMNVLGVDVSPVAVDLAHELALRSGVADRCRFEVWDLDDGLPPGPPVDLVVCHMYREPRLDRELVDRLAPGGFLAIATLSEVGATPGRFRAAPGELREVFAELETLSDGEGNGVAWLLGRKSGWPRFLVTPPS
jgi:2-polyprenyl-3-methyl-5-hydroxy-6-metoxy-1,4-benzoquinol methylase